jgi:uncharacterized phage infection (PIP) family protein YhgE
VSDESVSRGGSRTSSADPVKTADPKVGRKAASYEKAAASAASEASAKVLESAKNTVLGAAETQKAGGADRLADLSKAVHQAADDLGREMPQAAGYVHAVADRLEDASSSLRDRNIEEIAGSVNDFARKQPLASFMGALIAGFALSRFVKSTTTREKTD